MNAVNQPAEELDELDAVMLNRTLEGGWTITSVVEVTPDVPRRCRTYLASSTSGQTVFVKILDPRGLGSLEDQKRLIDGFVYEKELVKKCAERNMRRVVRALNDGELIVPGALSIRIHYLVFEWADLDIRSHYEADEKQHVLSSLRFLHHMATALHELHFSKISHHDVKPSNVLRMQNGNAKLAGLGHAHDQFRPRPHGDAERDPTWAAPEILYGRNAESFDDRCAADMYQLGSLAVFLFTSTGLNTAIQRRLSLMHSWREWTGTFEDALFYFRSAYSAAIEAFSDEVPPGIREPLVEVVKQLTDPDPKRRGHPVNIRGKGPRYGFERFVSALDVIQKLASIRPRRGG